MPFDLRPLFQALLALWALLHELRTFQGDPLTIVSGYIGLPVAVVIFFLAGLSEGFGTRAVVLFYNRLGRRSFVTSLILTGMLFVVGALVWSTTIWLLGQQLLAEPRPLPAIVQAVGIGFLPLLLAFLAFAPYIGPALLQLLQATSLLLVVLALSIGYPLLLWESSLLTLGGWMAFQATRWLTTSPTTQLSRWIQRRLLGHNVGANLNEIVAAMPLGLHSVQSQAKELSEP